MFQLIPGEYDVTLNGISIHYTVRGPQAKAPVLIAHSGGPGMDARGWDDFAGIDDFVTLVAIHPRGISWLDVEDQPQSIRSKETAHCENYSDHIAGEFVALDGRSAKNPGASREAVPRRQPGLLA